MISEEKQLKIFIKERKVLIKQWEKLNYLYDHDPRLMLFNVNVKFNDWLKKYSGDSRTSNAAQIEFKEISKEHDKWKKLAENCEDDRQMKLSDKLLNLRLEIDDFTSTIASLEYRLGNR